MKILNSAICVLVLFFMAANLALGADKVGYLKVKNGVKLDWTIPETLTVNITAKDGQPLQGAIVSLFTLDDMEYKACDNGVLVAKAKTEESGKAILALGKIKKERLEGVRLDVDCEGYVGTITYFTLEAFSEFKVVIPSEMDFQMVPSKTISGRVVDEDDNPIEGVKCSVIPFWTNENRSYWEDNPHLRIYREHHDSKDKIKTDADGIWYFEGVPEFIGENDVRLLLEHESFSPCLDDFEVALGEKYDSYKQRTLLRGKSVSGTITGSDGTPISGAEISIYPRFYNTKSDSDGRYCLAGMNRSSGKIMVKVPGKIPQEKEFLISDENDTTAVDFILESGKTISFKVVDEKGHPMPNLTIRNNRLGGFDDICKTDLQGRSVIKEHSEEWDSFQFEAFETLFKFEGDAPNCMRISYLIAGKSSNHGQYRPQEQEHLVKMVRKLERGGYYTLPRTMFVNVVDENKRPVPDASVLVCFCTDSGFSDGIKFKQDAFTGTTDARGRIQVDFSEFNPAAVTSFDLRVTKGDLAGEKSFSNCEWYSDLRRGNMGKIPAQMTIILGP